VRQGGLAKAQAVLRPHAAVTPSFSSLSTPAPAAAPGALVDDLLDLVAFVVDVLRDR
jgi:hypothetical protein